MKKILILIEKIKPLESIIETFIKIISTVPVAIFSLLKFLSYRFICNQNCDGGAVDKLLNVFCMFSDGNIIN